MIIKHSSKYSSENQIRKIKSILLRTSTCTKQNTSLDFLHETTSFKAGDKKYQTQINVKTFLIKQKEKEKAYGGSEGCYLCSRKNLKSSSHTRGVRIKHSSSLPISNTH